MDQRQNLNTYNDIVLVKNNCCKILIDQLSPCKCYFKKNCWYIYPSFLLFIYSMLLNFHRNLLEMIALMLLSVTVILHIVDVAAHTENIALWTARCTKLCHTNHVTWTAFIITQDGLFCSYTDVVKTARVCQSIWGFWYYKYEYKYSSYIMHCYRSNDINYYKTLAKYNEVSCIVPDILYTIWLAPCMMISHAHILYSCQFLADVWWSGTANGS